MTSTRRFGWTAIALLALAGCGDPAPAPLPPGPPATAPAGKPPAARPDDDRSGAAAAPAKLSDEEIAEIKKLPAEDQAMALAQVTCPVTGNHLGDAMMGPPIKQTIGDKSFFICCNGCKAKVKSSPDEVLAKLKK